MDNFNQVLWLMWNTKKGRWCLAFIGWVIGAIIAIAILLVANLLA